MATTLLIDFPGDGLVLVNRQLARFTAGLHELTPAFEGMAEAFHRDMAAQFDTEGKSASGGWAALNPFYQERKQIKYPGKPILEATGHLKNSLTLKSAPDGVEEIGLTEMVIGTEDPKAIYHQQGTDRMPARPMVAFNAKQQTELVKILQAHLVAVSKGVAV